MPDYRDGRTSPAMTRWGCHEFCPCYPWKKVEAETEAKTKKLEKKF